MPQTDAMPDGPEGYNEADWRTKLAKLFELDIEILRFAFPLTYARRATVNFWAGSTP
jgi:hypothetical protein